MYKNAIKPILAEILTDFFTEEQGNRVTSNNIEGLARKVRITLDNNQVPDKPPGNGKPQI